MVLAFRYIGDVRYNTRNYKTCFLIESDNPGYHAPSSWVGSVEINSTLHNTDSGSSVQKYRTSWEQILSLSLRSTEFMLIHCHGHQCVEYEQQLFTASTCQPSNFWICLVNFWGNYYTTLVCLMAYLSFSIYRSSNLFC